jgi:hypothetical protein
MFKRESPSQKNYFPNLVHYIILVIISAIADDAGQLTAS